MDVINGVRHRNMVRCAETSGGGFQIVVVGNVQMKGAAFR